MTKILPQFIGKNFYAAGFSTLYQSDALEELTVLGDAPKRVKTVPLLVPLTVLAAKYLDDGSGVVFKLRLPDGSDVLALTPGFLLQDPTVPLEYRISGTLLTAIPMDLTPSEMEAIKRRSVTNGMKRQALFFAVGPPTKENDWGQGGKQLIYSEGGLIVYLDENGKVVDWQSVDK